FIRMILILILNLVIFSPQSYIIKNKNLSLSLLQKKSDRQIKVDNLTHYLLKPLIDNSTSDYIFKYSEDLPRAEHYTYRFKKYCKLAGVKTIRFHDLRHSCASLLIAEDIPLKDIQEWLGYSTLSSTADIYVHLDSKRKISSANKLANKLNTSMFSNSNGILKIYCGTCPFWDKKNTNESLETLVN
ncbi:tyrosine-type recombinase/integrase, partial [Listeria welshimeri]|nr:tyrosine-type recombinase/integrase [Listeria welshimeri]